MISFSLHAIALFSAACSFGYSSSTPDCQQAITRSAIENSWQSTSYSYTNSPGYYKCFKNPMGTRSDLNQWGYFHTDNPRSADIFHWFAVKLKKLTKILSVSIISRTVTGGDKDDLMNRAANIEIWTANSSNLDFDTEHCNSNNSEIQSLHLNGTWVQCGTTPNASSITPAQTLTVFCTAQSNEIQFILLRKRTRQVSGSLQDMMNFINMFYMENATTVSIEPPAPHYEGSNVTIKCKSNCKSQNGVQLCPPKGQCFGPMSEFHTEKLQRSDGGIYTCKTKDFHEISRAELTVLYAPDKVSISPLSSTSCGNVDSSDNVEFEVISDDGNPMPNHRCTAKDTSGLQQNMKMKMVQQKRSDKVKSIWFCTECSRVEELEVNCSAQSSQVNRSAVWKCKATSGMDIKFNNVEELTNQLHVSFTVTTYAASPEPKHVCNATATGAHHVEVLYWASQNMQSKTGHTKTSWTASVSLPWQPSGSVTVQCTAVSESAWSRHAVAVWHRNNDVASSGLAIGMSVICSFVFLLVTVSVCICWKLRNFTLKPMDLVRAGAAGTAQAMRCISTADPSGQQFMYDNPEDEYDVVQKISSAQPL